MSALSKVNLTDYARRLVDKHSAAEQSGARFYRYPKKRLVFAPRKAGTVWMCMKNREVISEHPTRDEAVTALAAL